MSTADFPDVRWHGHWVAPDVPELVIDPTSVGGDLPPAEFSRALFRRVFDLDDVPPRAPLRLSADSRYLLWVNGAEVGRGPIRSQPRRLRYDEYDIAGYLRPGRNVMAVLVTYYGHANSFWHPAASSGVMGRDVQLVVEARIGDEWLVTDGRWRVLRSRAWRALAAGQSLDAVPVELLDARELDPAWTEPDFDDTTWVAATVLMATHDGAFGESRPPVDPYGAMLPRDIGMLGGPRIVAPSVTLQTAPAVRDLPDHPAQRLVRQLREAGNKRTVQLPLTVGRTQGAVTLVTVNFGRIVAGHVEPRSTPRLVCGSTCSTRSPRTTTPPPGRSTRPRAAAHDGFDTFGECWGWGTPVHAWSATPTKDLVWYVLGVTPAEPGFGTVRVAPRPGAIERLAGAVPTPHGLVRVEVENGQVRVDSPAPVRFVSLNGDESTAPAGASEFTL